MIYNEIEGRDNMKNNKGFTLVELLAMLVVLGVLLAVGIPNITGIIQNNHYNALKSDATIMVDKAKVAFSTNRDFKKPNDGECAILNLNYLDDNNDLKKGHNGGTYSPTESFVVIRRTGKSFEYYARILEIDNSGPVIGIDFTKSINLSKEDKSYIKRNNDLTLIGLDGTSTNDNSKIRSFLASQNPNPCPENFTYYTG